DGWLGEEGLTEVPVVLQAGRQSIERRGASGPVDLRPRPSTARLLDARGRGADSPLRQRRLESVEYAHGLGHLALGLGSIPLAKRRLGQASITEGEGRALAP